MPTGRNDRASTPLDARQATSSTPGNADALGDQPRALAELEKGNLMDNVHDTPDPTTRLIRALRALREAPTVEVPAYVWNIGTVDQWREVTFDGDGEDARPVDPPTMAVEADTMPVTELDVGDLYGALERVEANPKALARVHDAWLRHRRYLGTSVGEAEAVFTRQLGIARYVNEQHGAVA